MAEALGSAASVLTVIKTIAYITKYIRSCKHAPQESQLLVRELSYVRGLLTTLQETIDEQESSNDAWSSASILLNDGNGLLPQFQQLLDVLDLRIGGASRAKGFAKVKEALKWPFREPETLKLINTVERYRGLFELALDSNHIRLSQAIRDDVKKLSTTVQDIRGELLLGSQEIKMLSLRSEDVHKEVLKNTQQLETLSQWSQNVHEEVDRSTQQLRKLNVKTEDSEFRKVSCWLSTWNFWSRQQDVLTQRVGDTCEWFLTTPEFAHWKSDDSCFLHCYGPPGIGKTVLTSVIVDHLHTTLPPDCRSMAFFCDHADTTKDKYINLLGALLQQLIKDRCLSWDDIKGLYEQHQHGTKPQPAELMALLRNELKCARKVYVVLDALDEWSTDPDGLSLLLSDLKSLGSNVSILVTSRPATYIPSLFIDDTRLELSPPKDDLKSYLRSRIVKESERGERSFLKHDRQLQKKVEMAILERCEGLFLLARLQMDQLSRQRQKRAFIKALEDLPRTPDDLYNAALARIESQSNEDASLAQRTFVWIYYCREHTSISLLQVALAIEPGDIVINEDGYVDWEILVSICGGLVVMDRESQIVRFVHPTTRTFFEQHFSRQAHSPESDLTISCLTFLLSDTFKDLMTALMLPSTQSLSERDIGSSRNYRLPAFLIYAAPNVTAHYCSEGETRASFDMMKKIFENNQTLTLFWQARVRFSLIACGWELLKVSDSDKLCIASFLGLAQVVEWLIESGSSPKRLDTTRQTPLYAAASRNENTVVEILLRHGADPDQRSFDTPQSLTVDSNAQQLCYTPMHCALIRGNITLVRLLERHGVELQPSSYASQSISPLRISIQSGSRTMVEYVLQQRPQDLHDEGPTGYSPLRDAIAIGATDVVALLLEAGASTTTKDSRGWFLIEKTILAPIWRVPDTTSSSICKLIIKHTPSAQGFLGNQGLQLYRPVLWDHRPQTLGLLLARHWRDKHNDPESKFGRLWACLNENSSNAADQAVSDLNPEVITTTELENSNVLLYAVYRGWEPTVRSLLRLADIIHCTPDLKNQALCEAILSYRYSIIDILLDAGADINAALPTGAPLCRAILSQSSRLVRCLLLRGAHANIECVKFGTALHAVCYEHFTSPTNYTTKVLQLLVEHGADVNIVSGKLGTVLTAMAKMSSQESFEGIQYLLQHGADCNKTGGLLFTPLIAAASSPGHSSIKVIQKLQEAGADVNTFGGILGTALLAAASPHSFCGGEKIWKLVEWGADPHVAGPYGTLAEVAAKHSDPIIQSFVSDNCKLLRHYMLHKALLATPSSPGGIEVMIDLLKKYTDVDLEAGSHDSLGPPIAAALSTDTVNEQQKVQFLLTHSVELNAPALKYSNVLQMYLDCTAPYIPILEHLYKSGVSANASIGLYGNGVASEIAVRHYLEDGVDMQETWEKVIILLHRNNATFSDGDFQTLLKYPWFSNALAAGSLDDH